MQQGDENLARPVGDHDARKENIARAAIQAIDARGLGAATLADIAAEMGCTTGVLRHYFRSKDDLLKFTKNYLLDDLKARMQTAAAETTGLARMRRMLETALPLDEEGRRLWRMYLAFLSQVIGDQALADVQARRNRYSIEIVAEEMRRLVAAGDLPAALDPDLAAYSANCMLEGIGFHAAIDPEAFPPERQKAILNQLVKSWLQGD